MLEFAPRQKQTQGNHLVRPIQPDRTMPRPAHAENPLLAQQQALGNQAMQRLAQTCPVFPSRCPFGGVCHTCPAQVQTKLKIGQPGDKYEQEADRVAELVMRMPEPQATQNTEVSAINLRRSVTNKTEPTTVPPIVHEVLRSPGRPLDPATRTFMEPRFGHDFSRVRVHTDAKAAESAQAVDALAYTVGRDMVFGAGQYTPGTLVGRRLLAHELTHVVQQATAAKSQVLGDSSDPHERIAERVVDSVVRQSQEAFPINGKHLSVGMVPCLQRRVARRLVYCTTGTHAASANPVADLESADWRAGSMLTLVQLLTSLEAVFTEFGLGGGTVRTAYESRFGLPPARGAGFLNRLTGATAPTQNEAISGELALLARRLELLRRMFVEQFIIYRCTGGSETFAGCAIGSCTDTYAWACDGIGVIFLCPDFWNPTLGVDEQAAILIHEAAHINWARVGDVTLSGPGRNFRIADCYASFVADIMGTTVPDEACPTPPP
jgi:hypothetical protein